MKPSIGTMAIWEWLCKTLTGQQTGIYSPTKVNRYIITGALKVNIANGINITGRLNYDNAAMNSETKLYASTYGLFAGPLGAYTRNPAKQSADLR